MYIIEKPYVSEYLISTIINNDWPVLDNETIEDSGLEDGALELWSSDEAKEYYLKQEYPMIYANSENALSWVVKNLPKSNLTRYIKTFKDKVLFRETLKEMYPDFYFKSLEYLDINYVEKEEFAFPLVLKPSVGYLSFGVRVIKDAEDWEQKVKTLHKEIATNKSKYDESVVNSTMILIEELIQGDEFKVDAYFDKNGEPVILNIMKHLYKDENDISDRLYITSVEVMEQYLSIFTDFLKKLGEKMDIRNFPLNLEAKINKAGEVVPMEVNPMRFSGWCDCDITKYAWGFNIYEYLEKQVHPDWNKILKDKTKEEYYYVSQIDIPSGFPKSSVRDFNFNAYLRNFSNVYEIRHVNFKANPFFGIILGSTNDVVELDTILNMEPAKFAI